MRISLHPDYNEKLAYKRLRHLIKEEWTTNESFTTSTNVAGFRGFYGKYDITAVIEGKEMKFEIDFSKSASRIQTITI